jgi:hypothetical protein
MFAPPKLVFLILLVVAAWYILRWVARPPRPSRPFAARQQHPAGPRPNRARARPQPAIEAEDLVACGVCGSYVALTAPGCGKPRCPRPR